MDEEELFKKDLNELLLRYNAALEPCHDNLVGECYLHVHLNLNSLGETYFQLGDWIVGRLVLKSKTGLLEQNKCDCCGKEAKTKEFWFQGNVREWSQNWCDKCLSEFKESQLKLIEDAEKILKKNEKKSFYRKIKDFFSGG